MPNKRTRPQPKQAAQTNKEKLEQYKATAALKKAARSYRAARSFEQFQAEGFTKTQWQSIVKDHMPAITADEGAEVLEKSLLDLDKTAREYLWGQPSRPMQERICVLEALLEHYMDMVVKQRVCEDYLAYHHAD